MAPLSGNGNMDFDQTSIQPLLTMPNYKTLLNNCLELCVALFVWPYTSAATHAHSGSRPVSCRSNRTQSSKLPCQAYERSCLSERMSLDHSGHNSSRATNSDSCQSIHNVRQLFNHNAYTWRRSSVTGHPLLEKGMMGTLL